MAIPGFAADTLLLPSVRVRPTNQKEVEMNTVSMPRFAAEASLNKAKNLYHIAGTSGVHEVQSSEGKVLPQQGANCRSSTGPCTGYWP